jgi:peptidoglycan hydrolase CwlO-like protein
MKKILRGVKKFAIATAFLLTLFGNFTAFSFAADTSTSDYDKKISDFEKQKIEYLQKLEEIKQAKTSLKNEITYYDTQINYTQLQISEAQIRLSQAEEKLRQLMTEIESLTNRIASLESSIEDLRSEIALLAVQRYKKTMDGPLEIFLGSSSIASAFSRLKYLSVIEIKNQQTIETLVSVKVKKQQEKDVLDVKRQEAEKVKDSIAQEKLSLENYQASLSRQKLDKETLLRLTQNNEAKYQTLLAKVEEEIAALRKAIGNLNALKFDRKVSRGDVIGVQGSTGWSTGDHLHFSVYHSPYKFYQDMEDPIPYLTDGRLGWPIQAFCYQWAYQCISDHSVSQPYGVSAISQSMKWYPNDFHDAVDLFGPDGSLIYAAESGQVAYGTDSAGGNYAMIKHDNGLITMYWHLK